MQIGAKTGFAKQVLKKNYKGKVKMLCSYIVFASHFLTFWFSNIFRGYRNRKLESNGLLAFTFILKVSNRNIRVVCGFLYKVNKKDTITSSWCSVALFTALSHISVRVIYSVFQLYICFYLNQNFFHQKAACRGKILELLRSSFHPSIVF